MLVLTTTFKCSFKAFLTSTTLSSLSTMMAFTNACSWARVMLLVCPLLKDFTWGIYSLWILEHVYWEIPNNFYTYARPYCNRAIAFYLFSHGNALMNTYGDLFRQNWIWCRTGRNVGNGCWGFRYAHENCCEHRRSRAACVNYNRELCGCFLSCVLRFHSYCFPRLWEFELFV